MLRLARGVRLQLERTGHVLLFPEGVVDLNHSAHAILAQLPADRETLRLKLSAQHSGTLTGVDDFIDAAIRSKWIEFYEA